MCKPSKNLKLCTCSGEPDFEKLKEKLKETWKLASENGQILYVGETVPAYRRFDSQEQYLLDQLNHFDPFDFNYIPKEGDQLTITWNDKEYHFVVKGFRWRANTSTQS